MSFAGKVTAARAGTFAPERTAPVRMRGSLPNINLFPPQQRWLWLAALIIAVGLGIYWPALHGEWLWDDDIDITLNPVTLSPTGLWSIWFVPGSELDFYPIKATVQWFQWHWWGNDTTGYHATNIVLHIVGALLVWRLLARFGLRLAWLGGLIFVLHPVQVESVAWIAELKNVLAMPFFLLCLCAWYDFEEHGRRRDYALAFAFFLLAMLTKPAMAPFPVVILLYAWWKRGRIGAGDFKASAPFFALSLVLGLLSLYLVNRYWHIHEQANGVVPLGGFSSHLASVGLDLAFYFGKTLVPVGLYPYYPQWPVNPPSILQFWPWPVMAGVAGVLWHFRRTWGRHALLGLGYFVIMLAPFVTLNVGGYASYTWVLDHFLYFPILGPIGLAVAGLGQFMEWSASPLKTVTGVAVAAVLAILAWGSRGYAAMYADGLALCEYTVAANPDSWVVQYNLAVALAQKGRIDEAVEHYRRTLQLRPNDVDASYNWGIILLQQKRPQDAVGLFEESLKYAPNDARARNNLAGALMESGRRDEAIEQYELTLKIRPTFADARYNLGNALAQEGRYGEALDQYQAALATRPDMVLAYNSLGVVLGRMGRLAEAREQFQKALQIDPADQEARNDLIWLQGLGKGNSR